MGEFVLRITSRAQRDLREIVEYIARDNPGAAERVGLRLIEQVELLKNPKRTLFAEFIDRVADPPLRVYLYHIPPVAQVGIPPALIAKLSTRYGNLVAGVKDSSGNWENTRRLLTEFAEIQVFPGSEAFLLPALRLGAAGCISGTANVGAETMQQLYQNWQNAEADEIQSKLNRGRLRY